VENHRAESLWNYSKMLFLVQQRILDNYAQERLEEAVFQENHYILKAVYFIV
jgi:hypothetical protein